MKKQLLCILLLKRKHIRQDLAGEEKHVVYTIITLGQGLEQPTLVGGVPDYGRGIGTRGS